MTKGGIMPAIVGTFYLTVGAIAVALPLGVVSAIYLTEYARQGLFIRIIRIGVNCLAGVPSVVFGLFGLGFFVVFLKFGSSILVGRPDARDPDPSHDHRGRRGGPQGRTPDIPRGLPGPGRLQMAHHLPDRPALRPCPAS